MKLPAFDAEPEEVVVDGTTVDPFFFPSFDPERDDEADAWRCNAEDERERGRDRWSACDGTRSDILVDGVDKGLGSRHVAYMSDSDRTMRVV